MTKQSGYQLDAMERAGECFKGLETAWDGAGKGLHELDKEDAPAAHVTPWLDNTGEVPAVDGSVLLDVMFKSGLVDAEGGVASSWLWYFEEDDCDYDIVKWRYHKAEDYFKAPRTRAAEGRGEAARSSYQRAILENVPADEPAAIDKHYNFTYELTEQDIEAGTIKIDPYFVAQQWKLGSKDDSGVVFHIFKGLARWGVKNSVEREIVAVYKSIKRLAELNGVAL